MFFPAFLCFEVGKKYEFSGNVENCNAVTAQKLFGRFTVLRFVRQLTVRPNFHGWFHTHQCRYAEQIVA